MAIIDANNLKDGYTYYYFLEGSGMIKAAKLPEDEKRAILKIALRDNLFLVVEEP